MRLRTNANQADESTANSPRPKKEGSPWNKNAARSSGEQQRLIGGLTKADSIGKNSEGDLRFIDGLPVVRLGRIYVTQETANLVKASAESR
jgi:hypothetical protein